MDVRHATTGYRLTIRWSSVCNAPGCALTPFPNAGSPLRVQAGHPALERQQQESGSRYRGAPSAALSGVDGALRPSEPEHLGTRRAGVWALVRGRLCAQRARKPRRLAPSAAGAFHRSLALLFRAQPEQLRSRSLCDCDSPSTERPHRLQHAWGRGGHEEAALRRRNRCPVAGRLRALSPRRRQRERAATHSAVGAASGRSRPHSSGPSCAKSTSFPTPCPFGSTRGTWSSVVGPKSLCKASRHGTDPTQCS